jgi:PD-(D/E)XK nuclease superfamily
MLESCSLERIDGGEFRLYRTPQGNLYPSVSSVVGFKKSKELLEWRKNVGEEKANQISTAAANRGTLIHSKVEEFLLGETPKFTMFEETEREMFTNMLPVLRSIDEIIAIEHSMFSDKFRVAGTTDCIARIGKKLFVLDWKTSSRPKTSDSIHGYYLQSAAYAWMARERHGLDIRDMCIVMTTPNDGLFTFTERVIDWLPKFIEIRKEFSDKFENL